MPYLLADPPAAAEMPRLSAKGRNRKQPPPRSAVRGVEYDEATVVSPPRIPPNRGIDWFKPEDIAEIKVLKYPHELAVYGPSGVNGVIVITTKQAAGRKR
jgi:TonB-dependent SusC/RagA subfamily outer membrane receptor